jgi:hypothetical protein
MAVRFLCKCGKSLKAPDEYIGKKVVCSKCNNTMVVPEKDETIPLEKASKRPALQDQEISMPPLSEVRSREEILAEKSLISRSAVPDSSNMALQLLKSKKKVSEEQEVEKTGIKRVLDENKLAVEYFKYNAKIILPSVAAVIVVCFGLYSLMSSMVKTVDHPPLEIVNGIVTLDDEPLPHAEVTFVPQDEWKPDATPAESVGFTDEEGRFELIYSKDLKGASIGHHIVRIFSSEKNVPVNYNVRSSLEYTVKEGTNNPEFKLISK